MDGKPSIMEIFNHLLYEPSHGEPEKTLEIFLCSDIPPDLIEIYKFYKDRRLKDYGTIGIMQWNISSRELRANTLHKIWQNLKSVSKSLVKLKDEISPFIDYFDFYCDALHQTEEYIKWKPVGVIRIKINYNSMFIVAATVSAALAAGCSVIIYAPVKIERFFKFLEAIFLKAGLPEGAFLVEFNKMDLPPKEVKISKTFLCDSNSQSLKFLSFSPLYPTLYTIKLFRPNKSAAFVLESADLDAAADKIVAETWGKEYPSFAVSNVVVQESVYQDFFHKLKSKMRQFTIENKYRRKFIISPDSTAIAEEIISKARRAGASVEQVKTCAGWNATVIVNHHSQDTDDDVPVLKLLLCRTAKEGVALLNNCRFTLGTSVWSETCSQALEISSQLNSPNVWINCHGAFDPSVPLQLSGENGNCVLGGIDGILEYLSPCEDEEPPIICKEDLNLELPRERTDKISAPARRAFTSWQHDKNKRLYLKQIADSGMKHLSDLIHYYAHSGYFVSFSDGSNHGEFSIVRNKIPVGVILLIVTKTEVEEKSIASLITPALALGNAVIVLLREEVESVRKLIVAFNKILPKNVLNVVVGLKQWFHLIADPNVQAVWLYDKIMVTTGLYMTIPEKRFWIVPKEVPVSQALFRKECLQNKVVWLTKVDQCP